MLLIRITSINIKTDSVAALQLQLYIRARYLNSRGEPGNWGETITVIVA
jgi:hypothetical protein